jgi:enoyl-[acyl-carrier protein] reductase / trans-2-enoyl-CoA reductase (NAD+)
MNIQPKIRGFICTTAHPLGCAASVLEQIAYVKNQGQLEAAKRVLVIGASTGYGLASALVSIFAAQAKTINVFFEREGDETHTASPGWYNIAALEKAALSQGYYAKSVNGDAFSQAVKNQTAELIRKDLGQVDLIIYSLASPRRIHPVSGTTFTSALKPINQTFHGKSVDAFRGEVKEVTIPPASPEEIEQTVAVMGGEDWKMWIDFLAEQKLLAPGVMTIAYSYLGPKLTHAIYKNGTIGKAKEHLKQTADQLNQQLAALDGGALVSINKAVVTQASAAIPVVPLYISLLFKIMKAEGYHEGCIEQIYRLFKDHLALTATKTLDAEGYIRLDDLEMLDAVQEQVAALWPQVTTENLTELTDIQGYRDDFHRLFGFNLKAVDYNADIDPRVKIDSLTALVSS